ncbi:MAG: hypothetical protein ACRDBX_05045 [Erysipelotrichaceae bacterium]
MKKMVVGAMAAMMLLTGCSSDKKEATTVLTTESVSTLVEEGNLVSSFWEGELTDQEAVLELNVAAPSDAEVALHIAFDGTLPENTSMLFYVNDEMLFEMSDVNPAEGHLELAAGEAATIKVYFVHGVVGMALVTTDKLKFSLN